MRGVYRQATRPNRKGIEQGRSTEVAEEMKAFARLKGSVSGFLIGSKSASDDYHRQTGS
jgi:hypothetical protein